MFNHLESRLNRLRRTSHLDDAQISKFSSMQQFGTQKEFLAFCVHKFESLTDTKIIDAKIVGDFAFTFKGTTEVNHGRALGKKEYPIEIGLKYKGLTFEWGVKVGDKGGYEGKETYNGPFSLSQVPTDVVTDLMMGRF